MPKTKIVIGLPFFKIEKECDLKNNILSKKLFRKNRHQLSMLNRLINLDSSLVKLKTIFDLPEMVEEIFGIRPTKNGKG